MPKGTKSGCIFVPSFITSLTGLTGRMQQMVDSAPCESKVLEFLKKELGSRG